jgi:hypothetical protein
MRACWPLLAFSLLLLSCPAAQADSPQQPLKLEHYRLKAALPAICSQVGGTLGYGTHANQCQLPTATSKIPSAATTAIRALPITVKR